MRLNIVRATNNGAHILEFEGATIRSDAIDTLQIARDNIVTVRQMAKARDRKEGTVGHVIARFVRLGLLEVIRLREDRTGPRDGARCGYRTTDKGLRLLTAAAEAQVELTKTHAARQKDDPEDHWPRPNVTRILAQARRTQPNSVFDLARQMGLAEPDEARAGTVQKAFIPNSVFALGQHI